MTMVIKSEAWGKPRAPRWYYPKELPRPPAGMKLPPEHVYTGDEMFPVIRFVPDPWKPKKPPWPPEYFFDKAVDSPENWDYWQYHFTARLEDSWDLLSCGGTNRKFLEDMVAHGVAEKRVVKNEVRYSRPDWRRNFKRDYMKRHKHKAEVLEFKEK